MQSDHYGEVQSHGWLAGPLRQIKATAGRRNPGGIKAIRAAGDLWLQYLSSCVF